MTRPLGYYHKSTPRIIPASGREAKGRSPMMHVNFSNLFFSPLEQTTVPARILFGGRITMRLHPSPQNGFALVELIVVIVIVVIGGVLVTNCAQRKRNRHRGDNCANNLRQIGIAIGRVRFSL